MSYAKSDYPLLDAMWTMFIFFGWMLFIWLLILVYNDVFRRHDIGGGTKTLWVVFTLFLPFIGAFTYLIAQGKHMKERQQQDVVQAQAQLDDHIRSVAGGHNGASNSADQIAKAKQLLDNGAISPDEYDRLKHKALAV